MAAGNLIGWGRGADFRFLCVAYGITVGISFYFLWLCRYLGGLAH